MTLREFTARENLYELEKTGECKGLTNAFVINEAKKMNIERNK